MAWFSGACFLSERDLHLQAMSAGLSGMAVVSTFMTCKGFRVVACALCVFERLPGLVEDMRSLADITARLW